MLHLGLVMLALGTYSAIHMAITETKPVDRAAALIVGGGFIVAAVGQFNYLLS